MDHPTYMLDGNTFYTTLGPRQEVSSGNQLKSLPLKVIKVVQIIQVIQGIQIVQRKYLNLLQEAGNQPREEFN